MRFLICGLGSIGRRHLRNLIALGQDDIVLYRTGKSTLPDDELADFPVETDLSLALDRWQPEAVLITNPTSLHQPTALAAAERGAHLFLEKPISDSLQGLQELKTIVDEKDLHVLVGYQFRFHPGLQRVKKLLSERIIGQPLAANAHWGEYLPAWHPWEDYRDSYSARADLGGGVILTLSHPVDYLRWLLGDVVSLSAEVGQPGALQLEVESLANIALQHSNGVCSHIHLNYLQRPPRHDLEIVGTAGTIRWRALEPELSWWTESADDWERETPEPEFERNSLFVEEMRHFIEVIQGQVEPRCTLADGEAALAISLAALEAGRTGRRQSITEEARA